MSGRPCARRPWIAVVAAASPLALWSPAHAQTAPPEAPAAQAAGAEAPAVPRPRWALAPVRWAGSLGLEYRNQSTDGGARVATFVEDVSLGAASYIWQPWFVQVAGNIGLVATQTDSSETTGSGDTTGMTGNFSLSVFPSSRFPFQFSYDRSDSRSSGEFIGLDYTIDRWSLRQNYRASGGATSMTLTADRSTIDSRSLGRDTVNAVGADFTQSWRWQRLSLNASYTDNQRDDAGGAGTRQFLAGLQHGYRPDPNVSADTLLTYTRSDLRFRLLASTLERQISEFLQYSTLATWRPDDDHPLQLLGTLRVVDARTDLSGVSTSALKSFGGTAALTYRFSDRLNAFGTVSANHIDSGGERRALFNESAGASYSFAPRQLLGATYVANLSASAGYAHGDDVASETTAGAQFGHSLSRTLGATDRSSYLLTFGQNFGFIDESARGATRNMVNSVALSWRYGGSGDMNGYASLSFSDARSYGATESRFSLVNLQLSGQAQFSQYASGSASFTAQYTEQQTQSVLFPGGNELLPRSRLNDSVTLGGSLAYQHQRFLGVPRLRFTSQFTAYDNAYSRAEGNPNALPDQVGWTFDNRLDYVIGRLITRVGLRIAEVDGKESALVFARVNRVFGN